MKTRTIGELVVLALVMALTLGVLVGVYFVTAGVSARPQPGALETFIARTVRDLAIGLHARHQPNPVPNTEDSIAEGRAHFRRQGGRQPPGTEHRSQQSRRRGGA